MSAAPRAGWRRTLLLSFGALAAFVAGVVAWNWDTFGLALTNMVAMAEGGEAARALHTPDDLLAYLAAHPDHVSLVAFDVGREAGGIYHRADVARPLAGGPDLLLLAEYARQVERGRVDPDSQVALAEVAAYALPSVSEEGHRRAMEALRAEGRLAAGSLAVHDVVRAALRHNDAAAGDWLLHRLGRSYVEAVPGRIGLSGSEAPLPESGLYLNWVERADRAGGMTERRKLAAGRAYALAERLRADTSFRARVRRRFARRGAALSLDDQRALGRATRPRGTAAEYAGVVRRLLRDSLLTAGASRAARTVLERPVSDTLQTTLRVVGSEGGAFPGTVSFVGYARRSDGPPRVVVLLLEDVPTAVFYRLMRTGLDTGFEVQLLGDDAFFARARRALGAAAP